MLTKAVMKRRPTTPGEMLLEEFLKPAGMTQVALAEKMGVPIQRVNGVIVGRRAVTAGTALLLSRALGTTPGLWLNLQVAVDLWDAEQRLPESGLPRPRERERARPAHPLQARCSRGAFARLKGAGNHEPPRTLRARHARDGLERGRSGYA